MSDLTGVIKNAYLLHVQVPTGVLLRDWQPWRFPKAQKFSYLLAVEECGCALSIRPRGPWRHQRLVWLSRLMGASVLLSKCETHRMEGHNEPS